MAYVPDMSRAPQESARALRERYRSSAREEGRLRLLEASAAALAGELALRSGLGAALLHVLRFLSADSGLILGQEGGALQVLATHGPVLPVGARLPLGGVLAEVLRPPMATSLRERIESRLRLGHQPQVALELLVPLRFGARAHGLMAVLREHGGPLPDADDGRALDAVATMLGAALSSLPTQRARVPRREAAANLARLTPREQQILALLPRGLTNNQIAAQLGIAAGTVKIHIERVLHKLGVADRTQAAVRATEWGLRA
jgi:DNA-binding CsgD family transcriptional regulator